MKQILILILLSSSSLFGMEFDLKNKLTLSGRLFENSSTQKYHLNANYKPDLFITIFGNDKFSIDTEQLINGYFDLKAYSKDDAINQGSNADIWVKLELYRSWFRFSAPQFEFRIGRQKINFGTAQILRPLKWFDTIDPTDPQKNSEGVDALLFRYYFLNNANIWLWAVNSNINEDVNIIADMIKDKFEFGGRLQYPFKYCESALSYNHQDINVDIEDPLQFKQEDRFGFDCRWDFQIGL